jgi:general secretion pathway protein G
MGRNIAQLIGGILGIAILALIGAFIIGLAADWVAKVHLSFRQAYLVACICVIVSLACMFAGAMFFVSTFQSTWRLLGLLLILPIAIVLCTLVVRGFVKHPESGRIGIGKGMLITLILWAPILILGIGSAVLTPVSMFTQRSDKARYEAAIAQMRILEDAVKRYKLDNGVFPTTDQGLEALVRKPTTGVLPRGWPKDGYLDKQEVPRDPWGNAYIYIWPGQHNTDYDLKSLGADGVEGGEGYNADIESWRVLR